MTHYAYLIPVFPLIAFVINILMGERLSKNAAFIAVGMSLVSCVIALPCAWHVFQHGTVSQTWEWLPLSTSYSLRFGYLLDPLSATLLFVVSVIGTLIQIYSIGYMSHEPRYARFFAYLSLFMFAMLTLVIADNYIQFFMAWEIMGLCSYLLIGFYFQENYAAEACRKAFLTTRVGDIGFFLGIMTLFSIAGTLDFQTLSHMSLAHPLIPAAAFLILCGTIGKSAQVPLHVWLPDAMAGPTPVSALIHAATMVAAGVYLLSRSLPVFNAALPVYDVVLFIGTLTAFLAAFIALSATDIKKVLAYSTISQLGFMVAAFGLQGYQASMFHLMTHAFFKALLFLGAGSVIHGSGTQDLREMGGLFGKMKHTAWTFTIGALAIAGVPPLSGFWSKDEILAAAYHSGNHTVFAVLLLTAFMTAFYMFRLVFMAFFGKPRKHEIHAHESPAVMTLPLWALAVGAVLVGIPGSPWMHNAFQTFLSGPHGHGEEHGMNFFVMVASIAAGLLGIITAWIFYLKNPSLPQKVSSRFKALYAMSLNKLGFDEFYQKWFIRPVFAAGAGLFKFDQTVIDGVVNQTGKKTIVTSRVKHWIDQYIVDGLVNLVGWLTQMASATVRRLQTGFVQHYILIVFLSAVLFMFFQMR